MTLEAQTFGSRQICAAAEIPYQTLISWDKAQILRPSRRRKKGQRRYTLHDLVAALIAKTTLEIGLGDAVREIVRMVQKPDRAQMRNAVIITARSETYGFMQNFWFRDTNAPDATRYIARLRKKDRFISEASLEQIVGVVLKEIHAKYLDRKLAGVTVKAD